MSSVIDWDILKTVRETVDWIIEKNKEISNSRKRAKLNEIANQISNLAKNKAAYIAALKKSLQSNKEHIDLHAVTSAISTAKSDTDRLNKMLNDLDLDSSKFTFSLKHGLEKLTYLKQIKLEELEKIVSENHIEKKELSNIIEELEAFEAKWIELGNEIDKISQKD